MVLSDKINNSSDKGPKILIAPLDWGLGHATRCIPIIKELTNLKCEVWIAAAGDQEMLLKAEFPTLHFITLPGYEIRYDKNRALTLLKIFLSIPKILIRIKRENRWLRDLLRRERFDGVISDNRYGLYSKDIPTVFITHQLQIMTPMGRLAEGLVRRWHYRLIDRFSRCWVPDLRGGSTGVQVSADLVQLNSLGGRLSHPFVMPGIPTTYIGILSRMEKQVAVEPGGGPDLLVLLSGPEPQRSLLERKLLAGLADYSGRLVVVRGLPGGQGKGGAGNAVNISAASGSVIYDHLPARELNVLMAGAGIIICRAGYSTIMDLCKLGKTAILVPTPGQTEQEYLGRHLAGQGWALCVEQTRFNLAEALLVAGGPDPANELKRKGQALGLLAEEAEVNGLLFREIEAFVGELRARAESLAVRKPLPT